MWPKKLNFNRDECRALQRNCELEAYSSVISAFRAQGTLTEDKTRILKDLRRVFHISDDRHKAEARRVTNDERLNTIADVIAGYETSREWAKEGRRVVPLIPRGLAETALIKVADTLSQRFAEHNGTLPHPVDTATVRPDTVVVPLPCTLPPHPVPFFDEKSVIFDEKVAIKLEERIPTPDTEDISGWSRKRRSSTENIHLNQQLYPHVSKAQQFSGKKVNAKRPRKEKAQKQANVNTQQQQQHQQPPHMQSVGKIDFEESINRIQEQANKDQGFNMRIIHSYASSSMPAPPQNTQNNENLNQSKRQHPPQVDYPGSDNPQLIPISYISKPTNATNNQVIHVSEQSPVSNASYPSGNIQVISVAPIEPTATFTSTMSPTIKETPVMRPSVAAEKPPKIQILSNNPVKIVPSISLKTLQAKGNVKVVQSPPGKVVLRPFNTTESTDAITSKVTQIKGIPPTVAGAKLNVQKVHLMSVQNSSKPNANFLIVRNSSANSSQLTSTIPATSVSTIASTSAKDHMNIPVSTIQTLNIGKDGQLICVPPSPGKIAISNKPESKITTTTFTKNISAVTSVATMQSITTPKQQIASISKLEIGQPLQKVRLIPTSTTIQNVTQQLQQSQQQQQRVLQTSGTQIKLSKNSKLYPITYNNGAAPFTEMYVVNKNNSPKTVVKVVKNENVNVVNKNDDRVVDWESELDKKRSQEKTSAKVIVQSIAGDDLTSSRSEEIVDDMNLEEIIEYESESHMSPTYDDDDDKTVSQEEERSDIEMVSYESEDDQIHGTSAGSDKLSELTRQILND